MGDQCGFEFTLFVRVGELKEVEDVVILDRQLGLCGDGLRQGAIEAGLVEQAQHDAIVGRRVSHPLLHQRRDIDRLP